MFINIYLDMQTKKMGVVKPNIDNRNVHTIELAHIFDISFILSQLEAAKTAESADVIIVKIEIPSY